MKSNRTPRRNKPETKVEWNQEHAFPMIASAIERLYRKPGVFVSKREIVPLLLQEARSRELIEEAFRRTQRKGSIEKYAGNMVQWFGQRWTAEVESWLWLFKRFKRSEKKIDECWGYLPLEPGAVAIFPDEVDEKIDLLPEGAVVKRLVNGYERSLLARQRCIAKFGTNCFICGFSFGKMYGQVVDGFVHVHHLLPLSTVGPAYEVNPLTDLRPVCPNCHAVLHRRNPAYSIDEVRSFLTQQNKKNDAPV
jgi:predicted HNH restriction endonuclease